MHFDLSGLQRSIAGNARPSVFNNTAVYSIPEAVERFKRVADRTIDKTPYRILDAPVLIDDYSLNQLDWTGSLISIALGDTVYSYNTNTKDVSELYSLEGGYISSIKGIENGLLIGDSTGRLRSVDVEKGVVSVFDNHKVRVCSIFSFLS